MHRERITVTIRTWFQNSCAIIFRNMLMISICSFFLDKRIGVRLIDAIIVKNRTKNPTAAG